MFHKSHTNLPARARCWWWRDATRTWRWRARWRRRSRRAWSQSWAAAWWRGGWLARVAADPSLCTSCHAGRVARRACECARSSRSCQAPRTTSRNSDRGRSSGSRRGCRANATSRTPMDGDIIWIWDVVLSAVKCKWNNVINLRNKKSKQY